MRLLLLAILSVGLTACAQVPVPQTTNVSAPPVYVGCHAHAIKHGVCRRVNKKEYA